MKLSVIEKVDVSAAVRHGSSFPARTSADFGLPCEGAGQTMGPLSRRATTKSRRVVGAP